MPRIIKNRYDTTYLEKANKASSCMPGYYAHSSCCPTGYKKGNKYVSEIPCYCSGTVACNWVAGKDVGCIKDDHNVDCGDWSMKCPTTHPYGDCEDNVCYKKPRCPSAEAGEVFIGEDDVDNVCVYCPADHPIYDPTTKHCLREASVDTTKVGNCATLTTTLKSAFTDVTFADSDSNPLSTADYVAVAYVCSG